jgi:hypothetical protein
MHAILLKSSGDKETLTNRVQRTGYFAFGGKQFVKSFVPAAAIAAITFTKYI